MAISATVDGNMLGAPSQRMVEVDGKPVRITEFRVMSDVWRRIGEQLVQDEHKTRPVGVTIWNERLGNMVMKVIGKGMRIEVEGDLFLHTWDTSGEDPDGGKDGFELRMTASDVKLKLNRVEAVTMRAKQAEPEAAPV